MIPSSERLTKLGQQCRTLARATKSRSDKHNLRDMADDYERWAGEATKGALLRPRLLKYQGVMP
jgi:hypothetical protein